MTALERRQVSDTGIHVTAMGIGGASIGGILEPVSEAKGRATIRAGLDAGLRYVDTAPFYGYGASEHRVGSELRLETPGSYVLSSKVGRLLAPNGDPVDPDDPWKNPLPFRPVYDYSYDGVMRSYEDSLQRLGLAVYDIAYMHDIGAVTHGEAAHPALMKEAMEGGFRALQELKASGALKAIGLGVNEWQVCAQAMDHGDWDVFLLAGRYTLLEQEPLDAFLPECQRRNVSLVIGGPFNSGILAGSDNWNYASAPDDIRQKVRRMDAVCRSHNVPLPQAALQFPLAHETVVSVIPGPRTPAELIQNIDWMSAPTPASLWSDLKAEALLHPDAPTPNDQP